MFVIQLVMGTKDDDIRRMSEALKAGARMTPDICPVCSSPIFEIKGDLWCLKCNKKVIKVREEAEVTDAMLPYFLDSLNSVVIDKIQEMVAVLSRVKDPVEIKNVVDTLSSLLNVLSQSEGLKERRKKMTV